MFVCPLRGPSHFGFFLTNEWEAERVEVGAAAYDPFNVRMLAKLPQSTPIFVAELAQFGQCSGGLPRVDGLGAQGDTLLEVFG